MLGSLDAKRDRLTHINGTITFRHNHTHDNPGGTLMIMNWNPHLERVVYRENTSQSDGSGNKFGRQIVVVEHPGQMCQHVDIDNNCHIAT